MRVCLSSTVVINGSLLTSSTPLVETLSLPFKSHFYKRTLQTEGPQTPPGDMYTREAEVPVEESRKR